MAFGFLKKIVGAITGKKPQEKQGGRKDRGGKRHGKGGQPQGQQKGQQEQRTAFDSHLHASPFIVGIITINP